MNQGPERACLAIADVSGYTGYLAGVELDHAQDILADLISTVVEAMAPFQLSKLEGDAAFAFLPGDRIDGSILQDSVEGTYIAFRRRLRDIQQASSCECNACVRIPTLDLKFVVHFGAIARQRMVGMEELVGSDVILVHRLLKNEVQAATGIDAYALYTQSAIDAASIDPRGQSMIEHHEHSDVAGEVIGWVRDLEARWQTELLQPIERIEPKAVIRELVWQVETPPAVTFEYLTAPVHRVKWDTSITKFDEDTEAGRRGVGTTNHCLHGNDAVMEQILEWRPPQYWLVRGTASFVPGEPQVLLSDELVALPDGRTQITSQAAFAVGTDPVANLPVFEAVDAGIAVAIENLKTLLEEVATENARTETAPLPIGEGRHLREATAGSSS